MAHGSIKVFPTVVVASGASTSSGLNLGKVWSFVGVSVGTMSTAMVVQVQGSLDSGSTFKYAYVQAASAVTQVNNLVIGSTAAVGGGLVSFLPFALPFDNIRFVLTGVVSGGASFTVYAQD